MIYTQLPFSSVMIFQDSVNLFCDAVHRQISINGDQSPGALVVIRYRTSLLLICRESGLNHFQPVVIAGRQLLPIHVTEFIDEGWLEVDVIDPSTSGTGTASSEPACAAVRGNPSSTYPRLLSGCINRSRTMLHTRSSETNSPRAITALAASPTSVPRATFCRSRSPVEIC